MSVLDRLPESGLTRELRQRAADGSELKGSFQALGSDSVETHRIFSANAYDIQFTASATPDTMIFHRADVEFTPDDMTFGGAFCYRVQVAMLDTSGNPVTWIALQYERRISSDGTQKWRFYHTSFGYPEDTIRLKFYFFTTGSGTFTANVIT